MESNNSELDLIKEIENELLYLAIEEEIQSEYVEVSNSEYMKSKRKSKRRRKNKSSSNGKLIVRLRDDVSIKTIILVMVLLLANTFAWFIYSSTVDSKILLKMVDWDVELSTGESDEELVITADEVYPGMPQVSGTLTAKNNGQMSANITLQYTKVTIFGVVYEVGSTVIDPHTGTSVVVDYNYLKDGLLAGYPFVINLYANDNLVNLSDPFIIREGESAEIKVTVDWPYESGDDELDTKIGKDAYAYRLAHPDEYSVVIEMKIVAEEFIGDRTGATP